MVEPEEPERTSENKVINTQMKEENTDINNKPKI